MSASVLVDRLEQARERLSGSVEARRRALDAFLADGFPTRRDEAWKYTDLKPIAEGDFEAPPAQLGAAARAGVSALLDEADRAAAGRIVLVDGRFEESLSSLDVPAGLAIARLDPGAALKTAPLGARPPRGSPRSAAAAPVAALTKGSAGHPLTLLNRAFASDALAIRAAPGYRGEHPLEVFVIASGEARLAQHPRIEIELESDARLDLIVRCADASATEGWLNLVVTVKQAAGSRLTLHRLQEHGDALHHTSLLTAELGRDASLVAGYIDLGGRIVRNDVDVRLAEPGASAELFGVFVATPGRHVDDEIHIEHAARETRSDTAFRGIADRGGRGVFRGKLLVRPDAQKISATQKSDNLLLADQAEIDTRPELEIYADDVKCSHGATVGEIDPQQMFYLRSRGVDEESARNLLTFAFANDLMRRVEPEALRERATRRIAGQLPAPPEWEEAR